MTKKYIVTLTDEERSSLLSLLSLGKGPTRKLTHARILLKADQSAAGPGWTDEQISEALEVSLSTIERVRERFVLESLSDALTRRPSSHPRTRKLDGEQEAHLIALSCSSAPAGHKRWTLRLLADQMVSLEYIDTLSHETVRQVLKKNELKPWLKEEWCIPPHQNAEFVYHMEDVLEVYTRPHNPKRPQVCFDETSKQLVAETRRALPMQPGQVERYDYEYERQGVCNLFMFFAPLEGWRQVKVTEHRTKRDWAECMRQLVEVHFPEAEAVVVVMDQLNTHNPAALYEVFEPAEAKRILEHLEFHYTPKHGSWLNMAEIELSVLSRQCLDDYVPDKATLEQTIAPWQSERNTAQRGANWRFTTSTARIKLKRLYPSV